ncbi:MAG: TetR/AcrR family transcriptional regulator [Clostridia bacterium]
MKIDNTSAKKKIFQAAIELISSEENLESITLRQIAKKADVNLALINYYYQSKENLMSQVAEIKMTSIITQVFEHSNADLDAVMKLKRLLTTTADFSFKHNEIFKIAVTGELKEGCKNSCALVMPLLTEIFKDKNEVELKIIALQLMLTFHYIVLYPEKYGDYLNTDFFDEKQRAQMINQMTDNLLSAAKDSKF